MSIAKRFYALVLLVSCVPGCRRVESVMAVDDPARTAAPSTFKGSKAGDHREVAGIQLCWCPPGKFIMGSPCSEPERRPDEDQVVVTLTRGFWMAKYKATQGQRKRVRSSPCPPTMDFGPWTLDFRL